MKQEIKKTIYYDATFQLLAAHRGMALFLNEFLKVLQKNTAYNIVGLAPKNAPASNKHILRFGFANLLLWEQFSLPAFLKQHPDCIYIFPYNTSPFFMRKGANSVLFIHDLIFLEPFSAIPLSTSFRQVIGRFYRKFIVPHSSRRVLQILTVSEFSKQQILKKFNLKPASVTVIPNSILIENRSTERGKGNYVKKFFFNVGGEAPHKNVLFLINVYSKLPLHVKEEYNLRIAGINSSSQKKFASLIQELGERENIILEKYLSEDELNQLYLNATLFIFPSLYEGFGIPLLEAMKFGCPILCSNRTSVPEVCGEAAFYFDPDKGEELVAIIEQCISDKDIVESRVRLGYEQVKKFSRQAFEEKVMQWFIKEIAN